MSKHTKEPWLVGSDEAMRFTYASQIVGIHEGTPFIMATFNFQYPSKEEAEANAARAVACVEAMKGIHDPAAFVRSHAELVFALNRAHSTMIVGLLAEIGSPVEKEVRAALDNAKKVKA